jgi:hypothetical protein
VQRSSSSRAVSTRAHVISRTSISAGPRHRSRAVAKRRLASSAVPFPSASSPSSVSRSKHHESSSSRLTSRTYPPVRRSIRSRPIAWRRRETWLARVEVAPDGGSPSQRSSTNRSSGTGWLADTSNRSRSALRRRPATLTGPASSSTIREPRILNLTHPPISDRPDEATDQLVGIILESGLTLCCQPVGWSDPTVENPVRRAGGLHVGH